MCLNVGECGDGGMLGEGASREKWRGEWGEAGGVVVCECGVG